MQNRGCNYAGLIEIENINEVERINKMKVASLKRLIKLMIFGKTNKDKRKHKSLFLKKEKDSKYTRYGTLKDNSIAYTTLCQ